MLTLILVISALTGCMGQGVALTLNADGTCTYMVKYLYEKETFQESINQAAGTSPLTTADFTKAEETINGMTYLTFSRQLTFANAETMKMTLTDLTAYINKLKEGSVNAALYSTETINSAPFSEMSLDGSTFTAKATSTSDSMTSSMSSDMAKLSDSAAYAEIGKLNTKALKGYDSVYAYMKSYRMQAATILLRDTSDSITEIAAKMGYDNPSKFSEAFKKEFGELPSEFRKKLSK